MNKYLYKAKELIEEDIVFAYVDNSEAITSSAKGIGFVASLCDEKKDLSKGAVADKIVGKAAALLFVLLGVKVAYAEVLSMGGKEVFEKYSIDFTYGTLTESIQNRKGTGLCPMENAVKDINEPLQAHEAINKTLAVLRRVNG